MQQWCLTIFNVSEQEWRHKVLTQIRPFQAELIRCIEDVDAEFATIAVYNSNGWALQYLPNQFRDDFNILNAAVDLSRGSAFQFASLQMRGNATIVQIMASLAPRSFFFAVEELKQNMSYVKRLIKLDCSYHILRYTSDLIRSDWEICRLAVKCSRGSAMQYVAPSLKYNYDFVHTSARDTFGMSLQYTPNTFLCNKSFLLAILPWSNGYIMHLVCNNLQRDEDFILSALETTSGLCYPYLLEFIKQDSESALAAIRLSNGWAFRFAADSIRGNKTIALDAVELASQSILYVPEALRSDCDFMALAVKKSRGKVCDYLGYKSNSKLSDSNGQWGLGTQYMQPKIDCVQQLCGSCIDGEITSNLSFAAASIYMLFTCSY